MRLALQGFNADNRTPHPVALALGIATGTVCVGNIGSRDRFNYTVVGETVNQAARIETGCRRVEYDILMSDEAAAGAGGMALLAAGRLSLKGVTERIGAHVLVGGPRVAASAAFKALRAAHDGWIAALRQDDPDQARKLAGCHEMAVAVEPGLAAFYGAIPARLDDFRA
jgi:adenylate cyclase